MHSLIKHSLLVLALPTTLLCLASAQAAVQTNALGGTWSAPDNDVGQPTTTGEVTSNTSNSDKVLSIEPRGNPKDEVFTVEIYDTESGDILDTEEFTEGNTPPITMPPGSSARVRDDQDTNSTKPRGRYTLS